MEIVDVRGKFVWHQLMTRDVPGAKRFYSRLTGWRMQAWPPDPNYTVCLADGGAVAGIMPMPAQLPADVPSHWMQYIGTRDVDGTANAAVQAGGSIMTAPGEMPGAGRYAVLRDPHGAVFAILDPDKARPEATGMPPAGTFSWHELATSDTETGFAFYRQLFGWDAITRMDMGPIGTYLIFGWDGQQRGGIYVPPPATPMPPSWLPYVCVANADAGFALATSTGARELVAPMEVPDGSRIAVIMDPAGAAFAVHSMPAAVAPRPKAAPKPKAKTKSKAKPKAKSPPRRKSFRKVAAKKKHAVKKTANKARAKKSKTQPRKNVSRRKK